MTNLEASATRFVSQTKGQWAELVRTARKTLPRDRESTARALAEASGIGKSNLVRKIEAIHAAMAEDYSDDAIISMGQKRVLGKFVEAKKRERTRSWCSCASVYLLN